AFHRKPLPARYRRTDDLRLEHVWCMRRYRKLHVPTATATPGGKFIHVSPWLRLLVVNHAHDVLKLRPAIVANVQIVEAGSKPNTAAGIGCNDDITQLQHVMPKDAKRVVPLRGMTMKRHHDGIPPPWVEAGRMKQIGRAHV